MGARCCCCCGVAQVFGAGRGGRVGGGRVGGVGLAGGAWMVSVFLFIFITSV